MGAYCVLLSEWFILAFCCFQVVCEKLWVGIVVMGWCWTCIGLVPAPSFTSVNCWWCWFSWCVFSWIVKSCWFYLCLEKPRFVQRITVIEYDKDLLSLVLFAGVFYKTSSNPFRKKYFLPLKKERKKSVLTKYKSSEPLPLLSVLWGTFPNSHCSNGCQEESSETQ